MTRARSAAPPSRAGSFFSRARTAAVAILVVAVAGTATVAGIRMLDTGEPTVVGAPSRTPAGGARPAETPAATQTPATAETPGAAVPSRQLPEPAAARLAVIPLPAAPGGLPSPRDEAARLLDVSPDGASIAAVDRFGEPGPLRIVSSRGGVTAVAVGPAGESAPLAARFSPDGSWIAVVDGAGALWRVDVASGEPALLSAGAEGLVFGLGLDFASDGRLLVMLVGSVSVPLPSRIAVLDPDTARVEFLGDEVTAYQPTALDDGSVAYFVTTPEGTTAVHHFASGEDVALGDIGQAVSVDVTADLSSVAVERSPGSTAILSLPDGSTVGVADGSLPRFSPDGARLSVLDLGGRAALELDRSGRVLSRLPSVLVAWIDCEEGCAP